MVWNPRSRGITLDELSDLLDEKNKEIAELKQAAWDLKYAMIKAISELDVDNLVNVPTRALNASCILENAFKRVMEESDE